MNKKNSFIQSFQFVKKLTPESHLPMVITFLNHAVKDSKKEQFLCLDHFEKVNFKYTNIATSCEV